MPPRAAGGAYRRGLRLRERATSSSSDIRVNVALSRIEPPAGTHASRRADSPSSSTRPTDRPKDLRCVGGPGHLVGARDPPVQSTGVVVSAGDSVGAQPRGAGLPPAPVTRRSGVVGVGDRGDPYSLLPYGEGDGEREAARARARARATSRDTRWRMMSPGGSPRPSITPLEHRLARSGAQAAQLRVGEQQWGPPPPLLLPLLLPLAGAAEQVGNAAIQPARELGKQLRTFPRSVW